MVLIASFALRVLPSGGGYAAWLGFLRRWHGLVILFLLALLAATTAFALRKRAQNERSQRQAELERALIEVSDGARRNLGMALHDGLSHDLLNIAVQFQLLARDHPRLPAAQVEAIEAALKETITRTKRLARSLFPLDTAGRGFPFFLEELAAWAEQRYGLECEREIDAELSPGEAETLNQLHGIALEAAFNAVRHSGSKRIRISWGLEGGRPVLRVRDWGRGIAVEPRKDQPLGLRLMAFRARQIGADLAITTPRDGGTEVRCALALPREEGA